MRVLRALNAGAAPIDRFARIAVRVALAAAILGFAPGLLEAFHPLKAMYLRAIGLALFAWVALDAASGRAPRPGLTAFGALLWVGAVALSATTAVAPQLAWLGEYQQREGLLTALGLAGLHLGAWQSHRDEPQVRLTLLVALASACASAVLAQLQGAGLDPFHAQGLHTITANGITAIRPGGTLGNPVLLGAVLAALLPVAVHRLADPKSDPAWIIPAAALLAATLLVTLSRTAWLGGLVGVGVVLVLSLLAGAPRRRLAWTLAVSVSPALLLLFVRSSAPVAARLQEGLGSHSIATREAIAQAALQMWSERPWTGVGPDGFGVLFTRFQTPEFWRQEWIGAPVNAHSVPLQVLATLGAFGALAGFAWWLAVLWSLVRGWRERPQQRRTLAALAGVLAALATSGAFNVVGLAGAAVFAVVAALPSALGRRAGPALAPARRAQLAMLAPWVAAGVCVSELLSGVRELRAFALAAPARQEASGAGFTPSEWRAISESRADGAWRAVRSWDSDDILWRMASEASLVAARAAAAVQGDTSAAATELAAEQAARRAVALVPARAASHLSLAQALAARAIRSGDAGLADSATAAFEAAERLAPRDGWLLVAQARFQLARRDGVHALEVAQRITGLYPEAAVGHTLAGGAFVLLGRPFEARRELLAAREARWEEDAGAQKAAVEALLQQLPTRAPAAAPPRRRGGRRPRR